MNSKDIFINPFRFSNKKIKIGQWIDLKDTIDQWVMIEEFKFFILSQKPRSQMLRIIRYLCITMGGVDVGMNGQIWIPPEQPYLEPIQQDPPTRPS